MLAIRSLLLVFVVSCLLSLSASHPTGKPGNSKKNEVLTLTVFVNRPSNKIMEVTAKGMFHRYSEAKKAILQTMARDSDWCALGIKFRRERLPNSWSKEEQKEFNEMMHNYMCEYHEQQGYYSQERTPRTRRDATEAPAIPLSMFVIIGLSVLVGFACIAFITLIVMFIYKARRRKVDPCPLSEVQVSQCEGSSSSLPSC